MALLGTDRTAEHFIEHYHALIEKELARAIDESIPENRLREAARYYVFPAGKRVRPLMGAALCVDLGGTGSDSDARVFSALEFFHAASLVHDDLPSLDNDSLRRGRPTLHVVFGEACAVLIGDLLPAIAIRRVAADADLSPAVRAMILETLAHAYEQVVHGQLLDVASERPEGAFERINRLKTGALFRAAAECGVFCAIADRPLATRFGDIGEEFGLLFQEWNDFRDSFAALDQRGRAGGGDLENKRKTWVQSLSEEEARRKLAGKETQLRSRVEELGAEIPCIDHFSRAIWAILEAMRS